MDYEEGQSCPECNSDRITQKTAYELVIGRNLKTGKIVYRDKYYSLGSPLHWQYECRKCGWISEVFVE